MDQTETKEVVLKSGRRVTLEPFAITRTATNGEVIQPFTPEELVEVWDLWSDWFGKKD
jgi:hypothetical protein